MRRLTLFAVSLLALSLTSCLSGAALPGDQGIVPRDRNRPSVAACREISRSRCDLERCKGPNMDWVELQCGTTRQNRCVMAKGCATGD